MKKRPIILSLLIIFSIFWLLNLIIPCIQPIKTPFEPDLLLTNRGTSSRVIPETRANNYTSGGQGAPIVSWLSNCSFVIVWGGEGDGDDLGVFASVFNTTNASLISEFRINNYTTSIQGYHSVSRMTDTTFVVAWQSLGQDGSGWGIFASVFDITGANLSSEFQVNAEAVDNQEQPSVSRLTDTTFVVTWQSWFQDGDLTGVFASIFDITGANLTSEFQVNNYTTSFQWYPSVSGLTSNTFVIVWESNGQDGSSGGIYASVFDNTGSNLTSEFRVNAETTDDQDTPSVSRLTNTTFVVAWQSWDQDDDLAGVYATVFNTSGTTLTPELQVNSYTTNLQWFASVSRLTDTTFVVTWMSFGQDGDRYGAYASLFDATGKRLASEFRVNSYTTSNQTFPSVSGLTDTTFVISWQGWEQDGDPCDVYFSVFSYTSGQNPLPPPFPLFIFIFDLILIFGGIILLSAIFATINRYNRKRN